MNLRRLMAIAAVELKILVRNWSFGAAVLAGCLFLIGDATYATVEPLRTASWAGRWSLLVIPLIFILTLGGARRRDRVTGAAELVHSQPTDAATYLWGKFLGGFAGMALVLAAVVTAGALFALARLPATTGVLGLMYGQAALMALPSLAFAAALLISLDILLDNTMAILVVAVGAVVGSWMLANSQWPPVLFLPFYGGPEASPVYGAGVAAPAVLLNKIWTIALTLCLMAGATLNYPRRTPALLARPARAVWLAVLVLALSAATMAGTRLAASAPPATWGALQREATAAAAKQALAGHDQPGHYWVHHSLTIDHPLQPGAQLRLRALTSLGGAPRAVEAMREAGTALALLGQYLPVPGEELALIQIGSLDWPRLDGDMLFIHSPGGNRSMIRELCDGYWHSLAFPSGTLRQNIELADGRRIDHIFLGWDYPLSLFTQWVLLEEMLGPATVAAEVGLWRQWIQGETGVGASLRRIAAARSLVSSQAWLALDLWDAVTAGTCTPPEMLALCLATAGEVDGPDTHLLLELLRDRSGLDLIDPFWPGGRS